MTSKRDNSKSPAAESQTSPQAPQPDATDYREPIAEAEAVPVSEAEPIGEPRDFYDDQGRRHRTFISTKDFIPSGNRDNLLRHLLDVPPGHVEWLGSITGWATATEDKVNKVKDERGERELKSICLVGDFRAERADHHGELETLRSTHLYLPNAFAEHVKNALKLEGVTSVEMDCEIGVAKVTRGAIPFEWAVRSFGYDASDRRHKEIQDRQRARLARQQAKRIASPTRQFDDKLIEGTARPSDK